MIFKCSNFCRVQDPDSKFNQIGQMVFEILRFFRFSRWRIYGAKELRYRLYCGIGLYYGFTIFIVSLATALTVMTLNIHHHGSSGRPVPPLVRLVCFRWLRRLLCLGATARMRQPRQMLQNIIEVHCTLRHGSLLHVM